MLLTTSLKKTLMAALVLGTLAVSAAASSDHSKVITFDFGWEGWNGTQGPGGFSQIEPTGGNPGRHVHTVFNNFGIEWWTNTNQDFLGDLTKYSSVTIGIDVKVEGIWFFFQPVSRNLILDVRSFSQAQNGYPWSSVWYTLTLMQAGMDWATYSVTFDPNSTELPSGWGGSGAETGAPDYLPILPENLTFADIMSSVEELAFTTYEPGWFYGFTDFDIRIDNIRIEATRIPETNPADLNGDGAVDVFDLLLLLAAWGNCDDPSNCPADLDGNGVVDVFDLINLLANWG